MEPSIAPDDWFSDEELTALALAADPSAPLDADAVAWRGGPESAGALPGWYMPPAIAVRHSRGTRLVVGALIGAFLLIDACGLCVTSGFLSWA